MESFSYQHLYYFWQVAREGGISRASEALDVSPSTISVQVRSLETSLGAELFRRVGRRLELTDVGGMVLRYAEEIFLLGRELRVSIAGQPVGRPLRLQVGVADVIPKLVATKLLEPTFALGEDLRLRVREGRPEALLAELAAHHLDVVLLDAPARMDSSIRLFHHGLGRCGVLLFATSTLAKLVRDGFPGSLEGAPFLLPTRDASLRRGVDRWLDAGRRTPKIVAELEDSALMKAFGERGMGLFPAPEVIAEEICRQHRVEVVASLTGLEARYYAVTAERRLTHPAVLAIRDAARGEIFGDPKSAGGEAAEE